MQVARAQGSLHCGQVAPWPHTRLHRGLTARPDVHWLAIGLLAQDLWGQVAWRAGEPWGQRRGSVRAETAADPRPRLGRPAGHSPNHACWSPCTSMARPKSASFTAAPLHLLAKSRFSGCGQGGPPVRVRVTRGGTEGRERNRRDGALQAGAHRLDPLRPPPRGAAPADSS